MSVFHYDDTPLPVGLPVRMNGSATAYEVGLYDGAVHADQYADEPEEGVLFESPEGAARWLEALTSVLTPYIQSGDRAARIPEPTGWTVFEEN